MENLYIIVEPKQFVIIHYDLRDTNHINNYGQIEYEVQKKILGLFWWNFQNVDACTTSIYSTLEEAKMAIRMHKEKTKETIFNV